MLMFLVIYEQVMYGSLVRHTYYFPLQNEGLRLRFANSCIAAVDLLQMVLECNGTVGGLRTLTF